MKTVEGKCALLLVLGMILGLPTLISCATGTGGTPITIGAADGHLLEGRWEGNLESRGLDGIVYFEAPAALDVVGGVAKFQVGTGPAREAPIRIVDGKVGIHTGSAYREFELRRMPDNKLTLMATYKSKFQEWDRINTVSLTRK